MIQRATLLHLRIPFSVFLMPVFLFAASQVPSAPLWRIVYVFIIIHLFLYPASNGYNSFYDKDEKSIGGLRNPPPVQKQLLFTSLAFDVIALIGGLIIGLTFSLMLLIYGLVSKAYSHPAIRLKKYAWLSLFTATFFQGAFTYIMVYQAIHNTSLEALYQPQIWVPAMLSSIMIMGFYPMTQIYQHEEDAQRGDRTFSLLLGIKNTFLFSGATFILAAMGFAYYFYIFKSFQYFYLFLACMTPLFIYFISWYIMVSKDLKNANFIGSMRLNIFASICLGIFFLMYAYFQSH